MQNQHQQEWQGHQHNNAIQNQNCGQWNEDNAPDAALHTQIQRGGILDLNEPPENAFPVSMAPPPDPAPSPSSSVDLITCLCLGRTNTASVHPMQSLMQPKNDQVSLSLNILHPDPSEGSVNDFCVPDLNQPANTDKQQR